MPAADDGPARQESVEVGGGGVPAQIDALVSAAAGLVGLGRIDAADADADPADLDGVPVDDARPAGDLAGDVVVCQGGGCGAGGQEGDRGEAHCGSFLHSVILKATF